MRRVLLILTALIALVAVPVASAIPPERTVVGPEDDFVISGQCGFPVLAHLEGNEILMTFFDKDGKTVKLMGITPAQRITLTNLVTDESITVLGTGLFMGRLAPDGSTSFLLAGKGPAPPITTEPGIWYFTGRIHATFDAQGNPTSLTTAGHIVNLCTRLA